MSRKEIAINVPKIVSSVDQWVGVEPRAPERALTSVPDAPVKVPEKRLTIDIPEDLHRRLKTQCASEGLRMADVLREMLEARFPAKS
jgi:hypothetical protein